MQVRCVSTAKTDFEDGRKDFRLEAERLNRIGRMSSNIVKVNEVFFANDTVYYVMEYLEGGDLVRCVKANGNRPLSEARAVAIILPIIRAVEQLHKERLLHMDIKPDNIVLKKGGEGESTEPVLIDFGIAKHFDHNGHPTSHLVAKGASDGYAPMEQYSDIDTFAPEIDVYAIGATLYYLLTAENPPKAFDVHSVSDLIARIPGNVSERTKKVIAGAMQPSRFARTHDAGTLLRALSESYTLPAGYVLHGRHADYRIVEVEGETDCSITYKAVVSRSLKDDAAGQASGANGTQVAVRYLVHEFFLKHADKRGDDGSVLPAPSGRDASSFLLEVGREISPNSLGQSDGHGNVLAEKFEVNGTLYFVGIVRSKNPVGRDAADRAKTRKKWIPFAAIVAAVIAGIIGLLYFRGESDSGGGDVTDSLRLADSIVAVEAVAAEVGGDVADSLNLVAQQQQADQTRLAEEKQKQQEEAAEQKRQEEAEKRKQEEARLAEQKRQQEEAEQKRQEAKKRKQGEAAEQARRAEENLAQYYEKGVEAYNARNYSQAVSWYRKSAEQGYAAAQFALGFCYANGRGVVQDYSQAVSWYCKSAEQGYARAQYYLGECYANGRGVAQDYSQAVSWYRKAAEQGYDVAQNNLGFCYENGRGVAKDYSQAVFWYRKAAEQGYATAQFNLGVYYADGRGVAQDYSQAVSWFRKAAEQGDTDAQYELARCYYKGQGVTQDLEQARFWAKRAVTGNISEQMKSTLKKLGLVE